MTAKIKKMHAETNSRIKGVPIKIALAFLSISLLIKTLSPMMYTLWNKKVRQPKSAHRKTQTPIVAKQISSNQKDIPYTITDGICIFTKFIQ